MGEGSANLILVCLRWSATLSVAVTLLAIIDPLARRVWYVLRQTDEFNRWRVWSVSASRIDFLSVCLLECFAPTSSCALAAAAVPPFVARTTYVAESESLWMSDFTQTILDYRIICACSLFSTCTIHIRCKSFSVVVHRFKLCSSRLAAVQSCNIHRPPCGAALSQREWNEDVSDERW